MPFMGVRISWLMLARNSLFAVLAASAFRAWFVTSSTSFSIRLAIWLNEADSLPSSSVPHSGTATVRSPSAIADEATVNS